MERYICIHGHFYQPPRENPWLETIEMQDSAYPYHDWNERITAECYAPNCASRILDCNGRITEIVSNYSRISFNFGPTLLAWMARFAPRVYESILEADRISMLLNSGHGNAIAQVYNHIIMPLAHPRDKYTQIIWGIRDFQKRFGRFPEGMWLAETAVDLESLEYMAAAGIRFTILAPNQASKVRRRGTTRWKDVSGGHIDPTRPYIVCLPSGREITIFFYDGPISQAVAFEGLLRRGEDLAERLVSGFSGSRSWPEIMHIATDGETYGHHHRFGDMALAFALDYIDKNGLARVTNYGEYLDKFPARHEVVIHENTSWSCAHGIERWRSDCGCNSGGHPHWNQGWRGPLRAAFDWLRDQLAVFFEEKGSDFLRDPWSSRDDYIEMVLTPSGITANNFFIKHSRKKLSAGEKAKVLKLLEAERHSLLMYSSCGWFFDELSGLETVQVMQYAGRVIQLMRELGRDRLEKEFVSRLAEARSNIPEHRDGACIFSKWVKPVSIDLKKVAVHYAVSSVIEDFCDNTDIYSFAVEKEDYLRMPGGKATLAVGRVMVSSRITGDREHISFALLHMGGHAFNGGARRFRGKARFQAMRREIALAFEKGDLADVIRLINSHFGMHNYSFSSLFRDRQHAAAEILLKDMFEKYKVIYRDIFENDRPMMKHFREAGMNVPNIFRASAEFILNLDLKKAFLRTPPDGNVISGIIREMQRWDVACDTVQIELTIRKRLKDLIQQLEQDPFELSPTDSLRDLIVLSRLVPVQVNLWEIQNIYYSIAGAVYPDMSEKAAAPHPDALRWMQCFIKLGETLNFNTESIPGRHQGMYYDEAVLL